MPIAAARREACIPVLGASPACLGAPSPSGSGISLSRMRWYMASSSSRGRMGANAPDSPCPSATHIQHRTRTRNMTADRSDCLRADIGPIYFPHSILCCHDSKRNVISIDVISVETEVRTLAGFPIHLAGVRLNHSAISTPLYSLFTKGQCMPIYPARSAIIAAILGVRGGDYGTAATKC